MGANHSVQDTSSSASSPRQRPPYSTRASNDRLVTSSPTKSVKIDDLLKHASPQHQPPSDSGLHSRIDNIVGLPPPPTTTLHRLSTQKVDRSHDPKRAAHVSSHTDILAASSAVPEVIPFIKRRSLIYAQAPGLSTREVPVRLSMPLAVLEEGEGSALSGDNPHNPPVLRNATERAATPVLQLPLGLGSFKPGTLHVVNGAPSPAPSSIDIFPSVESTETCENKYIGPPLHSLDWPERDLESTTHLPLRPSPSQLSETHQTHIVLTRTGSSNEEQGSTVAQPQSRMSIFMEANPPRTPTGHRQNRHTYIPFTKRYPDSDDDHKALQRPASMESFNSITESQLDALDVRHSRAPEQTTSTTDDDILQKPSHSLRSMPDCSQALPLSSMSPQEFRFEPALMSSHASISVDSTLQRSGSLSSTSSSEAETAVSDPTSFSSGSSFTDVSTSSGQEYYTTDRRVRSFGKTPAYGPNSRDLSPRTQSGSQMPPPTMCSTASGTPRLQSIGTVLESFTTTGGHMRSNKRERSFQVKLQRPKSLEEMLQAGVDAGTHFAMPPSPASWASSASSEVSTRTARTKIAAGLPTTYVPFEAVRPGSSDSKVKFYRAPAHYSERQKERNPDLGMRVQTARSIGNFTPTKVAGRGHDRILSAPDFGSEMDRHSMVRGPRPMSTGRVISTQQLPNVSPQKSRQDIVLESPRKAPRTRDLMPQKVAIPLLM